jgi:hypothetical protein
MMLGLSLHAFTRLHVAINLVGIAAGLVFFLSSRGHWSGRANGILLAFTFLTSISGFVFPPKPIGPPFIFGVISLLALAIAMFALHGRGVADRWRVVYLGLALFAQYLNMVVLVVQSDQKVPALNALAPTGAEPVTLVTQGLLLIATLVLGLRTVRRPA